MKRSVTALVAVLAISGTSTATADAAPTGSVTVGSRISTGQLIATFSSSSDLVDPEFGFGQSWFPEATVAAPGEPCVAGSTDVVYVGDVVSGPGSQQATRAVFADAGTLCLWVNAQQIHLVASAAVPPKPAPAPPASPPLPAPTPPPPPPPVSTPTATSTAPFLGRSEVLTVLRRVLRHTYGSRFTNRRHYRRTCARLSRRTFRCRVSWAWRKSRYSGTVRIRDNGVSGYRYVRNIRRRS